MLHSIGLPSWGSKVGVEIKAENDRELERIRRSGSTEDTMCSHWRLETRDSKDPFVKNENAPVERGQAREDPLIGDTRGELP